MRFVGIDPSTKTGFVALDEDGQVLVAKELTGVGKEDPKRMATLIDEVMRHVQKMITLLLRDLDMRLNRLFS